MIKINDNIYYSTLGPMEENCILVKCTKTNKAVVIDPGFESDTIDKMITETGSLPEKITNTHCHYDHLGKVETLRKRYSIPFFIHEKEYEYSKDPEKNHSSLYGAGMSVEPDGYFKDSDIIQIGDIALKVIHTPGHTKGSCCFLTGSVLISGDTLFAGSVGRTDLYGGSTDKLLDSLRSKLLILDDDILVIPGHGRHTTIGQEKKFNPFFQ